MFPGHPGRLADGHHHHHHHRHWHCHAWEERWPGCQEPGQETERPRGRFRRRRLLGLFGWRWRQRQRAALAHLLDPALTPAPLPEPTPQPGPALSLVPAPVPQAASQGIRLFACAGKACRHAPGGQALLEALLREIGLAGPRAAHLDVRSCGCLDKCQEGPVVVAYGGKAAQADFPPKGALRNLVHRPLGTFYKAQPADARRIVDTLLQD